MLTESPHLDQYVSTRDLQQWTNLKKRFWEARRVSGDGPAYVYISNRAVRYRWGDVVEWLNQKTRMSTSDTGVQKIKSEKK